VEWAYFHPGAAFRFNPLVATAAVAAAGWLLLRLIELWFGGNRASTVAQALQRRPWPMLLLLAALANWIYLMLTLPK
jgi:hypothetical protein